MKIAKRINQILLILSVLAILAWGVFSLTKSPVDICIDENRTAEKVLPLTKESYASGEYQDSLELALGDQLPYAAEIKKEYNSFFERFSDPYIKRLVGVNPDGLSYIRINDSVSLMEDYLLYPLTDVAGAEDDIKILSENKNKLYEAHPEIEFYAYYIEKDNDMDFTTTSKSGLSERVLGELAFPEENKAVFSVIDFSQYKADFFKTDHHWNSFGAHKGYMRILNMILPSETPINPVAIVEVGSMQGSKSITNSLSRKEDVSVYEYIWPEGITCSAFSYDSKDYFKYDEYIKRTRCLEAGVSVCAVGVPEASSLSDMEIASMDDLFGKDYAEYIFENPNCDNGNILIFSDSFDNTIVRLLAGHFSKVYDIDLRHYKEVFKQDFSFNEYIKDKDIKYVLFIGSESFWYIETELVPLGD